jgi:putative ABC transport system permease protein
MGVELGDIVVFLIQGIEIEAQIVSIRKRVSENIGAYFYFTFEKEVLENAPQTIFSIAKIESSQIPYIQNEIVKDFPQVTVINGEKTAKTVGEIIGQISSIVSFFTLFSLGAGILILLSSIISTNSQRTQEAVFYKLVGANKSFIRKVFMYEYLIIGLISSLIAIFISSLATFLITKYFLEIKFLFLTQEVIIYLFLTIFIIVVIGYLSSINVFVKKPIEYIRENRVE